MVRNDRRMVALNRRTAVTKFNAGNAERENPVFILPLAEGEPPKAGGQFGDLLWKARSDLNPAKPPDFGNPNPCLRTAHRSRELSDLVSDTGAGSQELPVLAVGGDAAATNSQFLLSAGASKPRTFNSFFSTAYRCQELPVLVSDEHTGIRKFQFWLPETAPEPELPILVCGESAGVKQTFSSCLRKPHGSRELPILAFRGPCRSQELSVLVSARCAGARSAFAVENRARSEKNFRLQYVGFIEPTRTAKHSFVRSSFSTVLLSMALVTDRRIHNPKARLC